jgi:hypothetical protein
MKQYRENSKEEKRERKNKYLCKNKKSANAEYYTNKKK